MLFFAEKINFLLVNQQKSKQNFVKKSIHKSRNFGGLDVSYTLKFLQGVSDRFMIFI